MILAEDIRSGLKNDGVVLREMFERGEIPLYNVLLADSGYDCRGNKEIAVFKPIRRCSSYKPPKRINLFLRSLFCRTGTLLSTARTHTSSVPFYRCISAELSDIYFPLRYNSTSLSLVSINFFNGVI